MAVSFAPLRDALQQAVNRLTFGRWDEPYDVLAALGQRLEATADSDRLLADVVSELRGLGLENVTIRDANGQLLAGADPSREGSELIELAAYGHAVGTLGYAPPVVPLRSRDRRLLDDLAGHLGGMLHARQLTDELQQTLERIVLAREEERRRLRRDLHDGLGPALAGHLLRLDLIAGSLDHEAPARAEIDALRDELGATVLEVRRLVEGLRPPALDELGLAGAITQATQRLTRATPISVDLRIAPLPELPAAMEVAAYRIVTEAVSNAVRHADASTCRVDIDVDGGLLRIAVRDDGAGIDRGRSTHDGHGLQTMRERADELRGRLQVASTAGTTIIAELPLPAGARPLTPATTADAET